MTGRFQNTHNKSAPSEQMNGTPFSDPAIYSGSANHSEMHSPNHFNITTLLVMMLRRWRIMILFLLVGITVGLIYIQVAPRIYKAEAVLEMNVRRPRIINNDAVFEDAGSGRDTDAIFNTRFEKFRSPAMERLASEEFFKRYPKTESGENPAGYGRYSLPPLIRDAHWRKDPDANIVRVSYSSRYPVFAANLVNVLSHCAGVLMMQENQTQSDEAVKWLVVRAEEQRESLEEVEDQLATIREEVQLDSLQQRKTALGQALATVYGDREILLSSLAERRTIYEFVSDLRDIDPNLEILPSGLPKEDQLNELIKAWRIAGDELEIIAGRYTELHPEYRMAQEKKNRTRQRLEQFIDMSAKAVDNEIVLLERQISQMDERIKSMKDELLELEQYLSNGMQKVQSFERKKEAADNTYQTLLRRMEEARAAADEDMAFTKIIRMAKVPQVPVSPKQPTVLILCIMVAGALGVVVVVVVEFLTDTVGSVSDLRSAGLHVAGVLPSQKKVTSRGELATIALHDKFNPIVEVFSEVNALLSSEHYDERYNVLLMSSIMPGEGKTISACNLAISSAMSGNRTLLIDADLRRPQLTNVFSIDEKHPSLFEWLIDGNSELSCEDLVSKRILENMDVISSRPLADINPVELLGRERLVKLIGWARENYDRVIIDSPPFGPVGDAQIIANLVDGVMIVSRIGKTRRRTLKHTLAKLERINAEVLGCIVNDVPNSLAGMFSGAEGYGYGYGKYGSYAGK